MHQAACDRMFKFANDVRAVLDGASSSEPPRQSPAISHDEQTIGCQDLSVRNAMGPVAPSHGGCDGDSVDEQNALPSDEFNPRSTQAGAHEPTPLTQTISTTPPSPGGLERPPAAAASDIVQKNSVGADDTRQNDMSPNAGVHKKSKSSGSSNVAMLLPPSMVRSESAAAAVGDVTVEDTDSLDCGVCFLPLKPPIFQCKWGHILCSMCCDKLKATGRCHVCGVATGGYSQCHAMERLVESIRFPCPNAVYGCTARATYYDQHCHHQECLHMPCHCPGNACGFVGSTAMIVDHFKAVHGWPCTTMVRAVATDDEDDDEDYEFNVCLHDGFNFLLADCPTDSILYLFLLNVVRQPHGCSISVVRIHPHNDESMEMQCKLRYSQDVHVKGRGGDGKLIKHHQESTFDVECVDLSDEQPSPDECFQFVVPTSVLAGGDTIKVGGHIIIS
ncbi:unnamed protein product [Urochloa humidicola]